MNVEDWKLGREKTRSIVAASLAMVVAGCGSNLDIDATIDTPDQMETVQANSVDLTYEDFVQQYVYKEPWEGGVYIYDGDTPVANEKQLYELYQKLVSPPSLIVNTVGGSDDKWSATQAVSLTYCISNSFTASQKSAVISAMQTALEGGWETFANVNLTYDSSQDSNCTATNNNVTFDVRPVSEDAMDVATFELTEAEAGEIAPVVQRLLEQREQTDPRILLQQMRYTRGQLPQPVRVRVEADQRTNSLIVSGPKATVELAGTIIERLDRKSDALEREVRLFVPQRGEAGRLVASAPSCWRACWPRTGRTPTALPAPR